MVTLLKHFCYGEIEKEIDIKMIDDLFNLIINKSTTIPNEFYDYLEKLDLLYTKEILEITELKNCQMLKDIVFTIYEIYNSRLDYLLKLFKRSELITLYNICKEEQDKKEINDFIAYYKKSLINKYTAKLP